MKGNVLEAVIGFVVLLISAFFIYFAYTTSGEKINHGYTLVAKFDDVGGLVTGANVKINGIKVGVVQSLYIDKNYQAVATMLLKREVHVPADTAAAITTDGLMGNKFIALKTGFSEETLKEGAEIQSTVSAMNLEDLVDKFVVSFISKGDKSGGKSND
jgi:phospholipid/cholesterol/gamma-HCH transport system substrate-binding protein